MDDAPEVPEVRVKVGVRLRPGGLTKVDEMAYERRINRSEMLRILIGYATENMPRGWGRTP